MAQVMWGVPRIRDAFQEYYRGIQGRYGLYGMNEAFRRL